MKAGTGWEQTNNVWLRPTAFDRRGHQTRTGSAGTLVAEVDRLLSQLATSHR